MDRSRVAILSAMLAAAIPYGTVAAPYPVAPIPRVEVGRHTDFIKKLSVSEAGDLVLTLSDDKTARLWSARSGRLTQTLRVPIDTGYEGQLYAGALSPDGATAVVGGFAGMQENGLSALYEFDTATGSMRRVMRGVGPTAIQNIVFHPRGRVIAVGLADKRGVMVLDLDAAQDRDRVLRYDPAASDQIHGADFSKDGDLAISTFDGHVRLYRAADLYRSGTVRKLSFGARPMHVQFSPDGREIAVGFDDRPAFTILDAKTLDERESILLPPQYNQRGLHVVEWSSDGEYVYAGGSTESGIDSPIYRFSKKGRGPPEKVLGATARISDIRHLPKGAIAFATGAPEVGIVEPNNRARWRLGPDSIDARLAAPRFRVSRTGDRVSFAQSMNAPLLVFNVLAEPESAFVAAPGAPEDLLPARTSASGLAIDAKPNSNFLTVNGKPVALDEHEAVSSWAIAPDGKAAAIATRWSIRYVDSNGAQRWAAPMSSEAGLVNVTGDGTLVVATLSDGTIRWYRTEDGKEVLAFFTRRSGKDWIAWIPPGYYASSLTGDNYIGWHLNHAPTEQDPVPRFYRAIQFERLLNWPSVVHDWFKARGKVPLERILGKDSFDVARLNEVAPPTLSIVAEPVPGNGARATVRIRGEARTRPMREWGLYLNGVPITSTADRQLAAGEAQKFERTVTVNLTQPANQLRAESTDGNALGFAETNFDATGVVREPQGDLYIVAAGVNRFRDSRFPALNYASKDAIELAKALEAYARSTGVKHVHSHVLSDETPDSRADGDKLTHALETFLQSAKGADTVVVFLASHGFSDPNGNYYYIPANASFADYQAAKAGKAAPSLVRWEVIVDVLRRTAGKRVLIVDTCFSGGLDKKFDTFSLAKRSSSSSFALLAASKGSEESQEMAEKGHGLFTWGLLEALRKGYDPNGDGSVSLNEAFGFASNLVRNEHNPLKGPQTPQISGPDVVRELTLARVAQKVAARDPSQNSKAVPGPVKHAASGPAALLRSAR